MNIFNKLFQEYHQCQNQVLQNVGPDFDTDDIPEHFLGPNLGPNCLQRLSAEKS